jgi:hypothetical protein
LSDRVIISIGAVGEGYAQFFGTVLEQNKFDVSFIGPDVPTTIQVTVFVRDRSQGWVLEQTKEVEVRARHGDDDDDDDDENDDDD